MLPSNRAPPPRIFMLECSLMFQETLLDLWGPTFLDVWYKPQWCPSLPPCLRCQSPLPCGCLGCWLGNSREFQTEPSYLCIQGSRWSVVIFWSSHQTGLSCWGREWWRYQWRICCCRWSRRALKTRACGSASEGRKEMAEEEKKGVGERESQRERRERETKLSLREKNNCQGIKS